MEKRKLNRRLFSLIIAVVMAVFSVSICVFTTFSWFATNRSTIANGMNVTVEYSNYLVFGTTFEVTRKENTIEYTNNDGILTDFSISGILPNEVLKIKIPLVNSSNYEVGYTLSLKDFTCGDKSKADDANDSNGWFSIKGNDGNITYHNVLGVYRFRIVSYEIDGDTTEIENPGWTWLSTFNSTGDDEVPSIVEIFNGETSGQITNVVLEMQFSVEQFSNCFSSSTNILSQKKFSVGTLSLSSEVSR